MYASGGFFYICEYNFDDLSNFDEICKIWCTKSPGPALPWLPRSTQSSRVLLVCFSCSCNTTHLIN